MHYVTILGIKIRIIRQIQPQIPEDKGLILLERFTDFFELLTKLPQTESVAIFYFLQFSIPTYLFPACI